MQSFALALISVATICVFATLSIYVGNSAEFTSSLPAMLLVVLPYAVALVVVMGLPGLVMTEQGRARYEAMLCALAILLWLQSNILVWNYGVLDGSSINWLDGAWRGALDISIWVIVLWLASKTYQRSGKGLLVAAVATLIIQTLAAAMTLTGNPEILETRDIAANTEGRDAAMRFSVDKNIVHIVMDGFQSDIFAAILANSVEHDLKAKLRGFTYFDQHLGAYPYTQLTVPAMLSGKLFPNEEPVESFIGDTLRGETIINTAFAAGYEIDIAAPVALKNVYVQGEYSNAYGISSSGHVDAIDYARTDAAKLIDLALFRVVPHFVKALVHRDELWVFQATAQVNTYLQMQYFSDLAFLDELAEGMSADRDVPVYKMIHVMLSHRPFVGNDRCEFDGRKPGSREEVLIHAKCGLVAVLNVLQRMKDLGIYDNSLIVLMADHGAWLPIENFASSDQVNALVVGMATPTLAIKPPNANHEFQVSSIASSIIDVPATIADVAGFETRFIGKSVFSIAADEARQRHHLTYGYGINPDAEGFLFPMQEFLIDGNPYDAASWQKGSRFLPGN